MNEHPIQGLMQTAMQSIKDMVDVNTIVGDAVETADGSVIIPISRVAFGFAAGGADYEAQGEQEQMQQQAELPFGGGSGAGVSVRPVAFLVVGNGNVNLLPVEGPNNSVDHLIDMAPQVIQQIQSMFGKQNTAQTTDTMQQNITGQTTGDTTMT